LSLDNEDGVTTLGLQWNPKTDQLQVRNNSSPSNSTHTASTKRKVLATTASIFDPLGLLNRAVIVHKVFLQKLWQDQLDWDTQLPTPLEEHWNRLMHSIPQLFHIKFLERWSSQTPATFKYTGSVTAVNGHTGHVCTFALLTTRTKQFVSCYVLPQG